MSIKNGDTHNFGQRVQSSNVVGYVSKPRPILWEWLLLSAESRTRQAIHKHFLNELGTSPFSLYPSLEFHFEDCSSGRVEMFAEDLLPVDCLKSNEAYKFWQNISLMMWLGKVSKSILAFENFQMIGMLSFGEYLVGSMAKHLSVLQEFSWRTATCIRSIIQLAGTPWKRKMRRPMFSILFFLIFFVPRAFGGMLSIKLQFPQMKVTLDPHRMEDAYSMFFVLQLHRGLFRYSPQGEVLPDLVESWDLSADKLVYRFKLHAAKFSDGRPITSQDVVNSLARIFAGGASIGADLDAIKGVSEFRRSGNLSALGVVAIDNRTVEVKLSHPSSLFLKQLAAADCAVLKIKNVVDLFDVKVGTPTSGPYKLAQFDSKKIVLEKWRTDKLDSANPPQVIEASLSSEDPYRLALDGKVDVLDREFLNAEAIQSLGMKSWHQATTELVMERFLVVNPDKIALETRRLLFSMVDQNKVIELLGDKRFSPAFGLIPYGMAGSLVESEISELRHVGTKNSRSDVKKIKLYYNSESMVDPKLARYLQTIWESSNQVQIELIPKSGAELLSMMFRKEGEILFGSKGLDYFDGYSVLSYFRSTYDSNYFFVKSQEIDRLLDEVASVESTSERTKKYKEVQRQILSQYTVIPLAFGSLAAGLWGPRISYVPPHPGGLHTLPMETVRIKQ